jgi:apolipoprotein N-acyltransferase
VLAGVLLAAAYPPVRLVLPAFVGLVPLLVFIAERPAGPEGRWSAMRAGLLTGAVYFGLQLYWMAVALGPHSRLAVPAYLLSVALLAGLLGAFAWSVHYTAERLGLPLALAAALLWTTAEWVQGRMGPFAFPWLGLGYALVPFPTLAGAADLVGGRGLTLWIAAVNGLLAMAVVAWRGAAPGRGMRVAPVRLLAAALCLALVPAGYGVWRAATLEMRPVARVAVVQPDIPQRIRRAGPDAVDTSMAVLSGLTLDAAGPRPGRLVAAGGAAGLDLVAWPEVALPVDLAGYPALDAAIRQLSHRIGAPILAGAYGSDPDGRLYNSAFLVRPDGGDGGRYDKRRLVPFVERVPLRPAGGRYGGLQPGGDPTLLHTGGAAFGVLICSEAIFGGLARGHRLAGADFLVNTTNDAWFGGDARFNRTTALWQHPVHVAMRAIESRVGIARAANTGISMFIDPLGRTHQVTATFTPDVQVATLLTTDGLTLYARWGDWLATLAALASVALVVAAAIAPAARRSARGTFRSTHR